MKTVWIVRPLTWNTIHVFSTQDKAMVYADYIKVNYHEESEIFEVEVDYFVE